LALQCFFKTDSDCVIFYLNLLNKNGVSLTFFQTQRYPLKSKPDEHKRSFYLKSCQLEIMKNQFEDFIYQRVRKPRGHEVQEILSIFSEKKFDKGALFKEGDTVIKKLGFLVDGSARTYFINDKGDEITDEIVQKNNFLSDIISVRTEEKSPIIIEILEKSIVPRS
jgi:hypothetical protein